MFVWNGLIVERTIVSLRMACLVATHKSYFALERQDLHYVLFGVQIAYTVGNSHGLQLQPFLGGQGEQGRARS